MTTGSKLDNRPTLVLTNAKDEQKEEKGKTKVLFPSIVPEFPRSRVLSFVSLSLSFSRPPEEDEDTEDECAFFVMVVFVYSSFFPARLQHCKSTEEEEEEEFPLLSFALHCAYNTRRTSE
jgi:hypothetical protein